MRHPLLHAWLVVALVTASASAAASRIVDIHGRTLRPFEPSGPAHVVFFVATDCPISNGYAPEIQRVCRDYAPSGVDCSLIYEDVDLSPSSGHLERDVRRHVREFGYGRIPAAIDRARDIASRARVTVTPSAVVVDRAGEIRYRGRIDNFYAAFGTSRRHVTERHLRDALDAVLARRPVRHANTEAIGCYIVDPRSLRNDRDRR
jgi:hypothetical protein